MRREIILIINDVLQSLRGEASGSSRHDPGVHVYNSTMIILIPRGLFGRSERSRVNLFLFVYNYENTKIPTPSKRRDWKEKKHSEWFDMFHSMNIILIIRTSCFIFDPHHMFLLLPRVDVKDLMG